MRIAVSSRSFRLPLASGELTQLEWIERCGSVLGVDGIVADLADFPRTDAEYVAQLRKVTVDLGMVPFGLDAPGLLRLPLDLGAIEAAFAVATGFGALVIRTELPPPGEVPPATFVEAVAVAKTASRVAKQANVTILVVAEPGTLGQDLGGVKHLLKDVDSAWMRPSPSAADVGALGPKDRVPAFRAAIDDDPIALVAEAGRTWAILDAPDTDRPWDIICEGVAAARLAEAQLRLIRR